MTAKAMITAIWARMNTASSTLFTPVPSGASQCPTICGGERAVRVGEHARC